jgi:hypothetical protein
VHSQLDLQAIRAAIETVRDLDLVNVSIDDIKLALAPIIEGRIVNAPVLNVGTPVWRARKISKPSHIRDLSYPPAHLAPIGRANRVGLPVLYCSASREGALFEVTPTVGDTVAFAQWKTTAPLLANHVGYSRDTFSRLGSHRTHGSFTDRPLEEPGGPEHGEITDFFATTFAQRIAPTEPHFYKISIALAEMLGGQDLFNGLIYPTIAMRANSDNVAVKSLFADQHLQFVRTEFVRVDEVRESGFEAMGLDIATHIAGDGTIVWRDRPDQLTVMKERPLVLTAENRRWAARDIDGKIVEPG